MRTQILVTFLLLSITSLTMATSAFIGDWKLVEVYDENDALVTLPDGEFVLKIQEGNDDATLNFSTKIGNVLRGSIKLQDDSGAVEFGPIMSTMMMPPEPLWKLESFLNNALPKVTTMDSTDSSLELKGEGGKFKYDLQV